MNEATRAYIYRIIVTLIPCLIIAGIAVDSTQTEAILNLAAAILGLGGGGLAAANTSRS